MVSETRCVCLALRPVAGEEGILGIEVPTGCDLLGANTSLWPGLLLDKWLGWPDPINRLVLLSPNFLIRKQRLGSIGNYKKSNFYNLSILHLEPRFNAYWISARLCIPLLDPVVGGD